MGWSPGGTHTAFGSLIWTLSSLLSLKSGFVLTVIGWVAATARHLPAWLSLLVGDPFQGNHVCWHLLAPAGKKQTQQSRREPGEAAEAPALGGWPQATPPRGNQERWTLLWGRPRTDFAGINIVFSTFVHKSDSVYPAERFTLRAVRKHRFIAGCSFSLTAMTIAWYHLKQRGAESPHLSCARHTRCHVLVTTAVRWVPSLSPFSRQEN